ncbi:peptidase S8, subtilisin-related protein [Artemisia annua]|uniref:Peptidase S8, subtilisin-related protein n=1 Tax=Artemisia annua TaxID=35608 RepID=A0A2U1LE63_ARTAN|nr:peptidase S8, subtilisin-related protein [Artemisia annua]
MSCPHIAAAVAYVKSFHPEWSPSAIKSALMTTDPVKAIDLGLIYDTSMDDYHKIWCHVSKSVANFTLLNATLLVTKGSSKLHYTVKRKRLHLTSHNQKLSFVVTVKGQIESQLTIESATLLWRDESHNVRSPVVVYRRQLLEEEELPHHLDF